MIKLENIKKSFGQTEVLKGISGQFERGKVYGIIGRNGAGKTTLFKGLAGIHALDGQVLWDGNNGSRNVAFLETNPIYMSRVTGAEYIRLLNGGTKIKREEMDLRNIFDLPLDRYASNYSTGMKKKLAIMALFFRSYDLYILDEPFNGVDIQSNLLISEFIAKLQKEHKIVLISSHIFSTLRSSCDVIFMLEDGVFTQKVGKNDFTTLEQEMVQYSVGDLIENLKLGLE